MDVYYWLVNYIIISREIFASLWYTSVRSICTSIIWFRTRSKICASNMRLSENVPQNLRIDHASPTRIWKFVSSPTTAYSKEMRVWQGDFLIQTKTVACSECIMGYNGERKREREKVCMYVYNVAWQLIHVRVIHFREPREHSCWYYVQPTLCCIVRPSEGALSPPPSSRFSPRRCTHGRWMQPSDRRTKSRWSDFKSINDGFALNLQSAPIRITRYTPTNCVCERFNENILIDVTRLPESPDSLEIWLKRPAIVEIAFHSSYKHDCMYPLSLQSVYLYRNFNGILRLKKYHHQC